MEKGPSKSRPDFHQTTRAIVGMNKEAGQTQKSKRRHSYRQDLDSEKLDWLIWLSHNWKWYFAVNQISELNSTQWHHQKSSMLKYVPLAASVLDNLISSGTLDSDACPLPVCCLADLYMTNSC